MSEPPSPAQVPGEIATHVLQLDEVAALQPLITEHARYEHRLLPLPGDWAQRTKALVEVGLLPLFSAARDGRTIGCASLTRETSTWSAAAYSHLDFLFVSADERGGGVGGLLFTAAATVARGRGDGELQWQTPAQNAGAVNTRRHEAECSPTERGPTVRNMIDQSGTASAPSTSSPTPQAPAAASRWVPAFAALALLWGCSFALIHIGLQALTPVQVAFWRLALGALTLLVISAATHTRLPRARRTWVHLLVLALLLNAVPFTLFAVGQQSVSSVLAGIINATTPLATLVVILAAFREERPTRARTTGLLIGFAGVAVVLGIWRGFTGNELTGVLACLGAVACYGVAFPYSRRYLAGSGEGPVALATAQVLLAAGLVLPVLVITGAAPTAPVTPTVIAAMLALGALCSGVAYVLNFRIVAAAGASTASSVTYLTPVVAAVVGVSVLGEHVQWNQPVGAVVVLVGIAVSQGLHRAVAARISQNDSSRSSG